MESRKDDPKPEEAEEEFEQREYSSPPCYLHEFESNGEQGKARSGTGPVPDIEPAKNVDDGA